MPYTFAVALSLASQMGLGKDPQKWDKLFSGLRAVLLWDPMVVALVFQASRLSVNYLQNPWCHRLASFGIGASAYLANRRTGYGRCMCMLPFGKDPLWSLPDVVRC